MKKLFLACLLLLIIACKQENKIEEKVAEKENEIDDLTRSLNSIEASDYVKIQEVSQKIEASNKDLEIIMERWVELSEK